MELRIDSQKATVFDVKAEEPEPAVYELRTEVKALTGKKPRSARRAGSVNTTSET